METFAKTITLYDTQVLFFWEYEPDEEDYSLTFKCSINGIRVTKEFRIDKKSDLIDLFNKFNEPIARKMVDDMKQLLGEN